MNKVQQYKELKQIISEKHKELKIRIKRLHYNIFAGVSKNSINTQKDEISEIKIDNTEYMQIDYIDYELESEDSIYEISENETDTEIDSEIDESNE